MFSGADGMKYRLAESVGTWTMTEPALAFEPLGALSIPTANRTGRRGGERAPGVLLPGCS